jgi:hypothetical protein
MLELVCSAPFGCPNKNVQHETDDLKEMHGTKEKPLPLGETRIKKYVAWEYEEIGRILGIYHRCFQQLFQDTKQSPRVSMDRIAVRDIKGNHHVFYFDISGPINEDLVIREKAWKDYQEGKTIDPRLKADFEKALEIQKKNSRIVRL